MPNFENIKFDIILGSDYTVDPPQITIYVNDAKKYSGNLVDSITQIQFACDLEFGQQHKIKIIRSGKENCSIADLEQIAWLEKLIIDGVDVQNIIWSSSLYYPVFPKVWYNEQLALGQTPEYPVHSGTHWGHDGYWELEFSSPFYLFLIERMQQ